MTGNRDDVRRADPEPMPEGAPAIDEVIAGKYRVERLLGVGGMGVVVAARQLNLDTRVAIKFLLPGTLKNADAAARFTREAQAAVRITSEHVARVLDVGSLDNGAPYIVMEFLEGTDLATRLKSLGPLSIEEAVEDVLQACEALSEAHGLGIVHRDLKPANLFCIRRPDGLPWIKVVDFGISKFLGDGPSSSQIAMTQSAVVMGSPAYMSPEQMQSARYVDARSDIWALGVVMFELLTGRQPFEGESFAEVVLQVNTRPAPGVRAMRPECPEQLEQVILRCLERDRDKRFGDVAALAMALLPFAPERARGSVERIARAAQRSSGLTMTGVGFVPTGVGTPGIPVHTLTALGHTTSRPRGTRRPVLWTMGAVVTVALLLLAGAIRFVAKPRPEPAAAPPAPIAVQALEAPPSARPPLPGHSSTPLPDPSSPPAPEADDSRSPTAAPPATTPRIAAPSQPRPNPNPSQHLKPQKPASSTQPPKHEDIF